MGKIKRYGKVNGFLFEKSEKSKFMKPIPIKISTNTRKDAIEYWWTRLQWYLTKQRRKKNSQSRSGRIGNGSRANIQ